MAPAPNRHLLIYGHSLGGNILLQGLFPTYEQRLGDTKPGEPVPGVGDLVVLINPASEARNMANLQLAARRHVGINDGYVDSNSYLDPDECAKASSRLSSAKCKEVGTHRSLKPSSQPLLISLTASAYFNIVINNDPEHLNNCALPKNASEAECDQKHESDWATGTLFPLMKRVSLLGSGSPTQEVDIQAVGHLLPMRRIGGIKDEVSVFGVSHELELDRKRTDQKRIVGIASSFGLAGDARTEPSCSREAHFMKWQEDGVAKRQEDGAAKQSGKFGRLWDVKLDQTSPVDPEEQVILQVRHGAARQMCSDENEHQNTTAVCQALANNAASSDLKGKSVQVPALGHAWEPVWNVGAHSNAIASHGGYVSHTVWCFMNRMALDR
jgi:hypothetical protein